MQKRQINAQSDIERVVDGQDVLGSGHIDEAVTPLIENLGFSRLK